METFEAINGRKSIRGFKPNPIPRATLEKILKAAAKSPSYTNTQPWEVMVVSGKKRDELSNLLYGMVSTNAPGKPDFPFPTAWPAALDDRAKKHNARRFEALQIARDDTKSRTEMRWANFKFYGAPTALFLFMDATLTPWSIYDMGLFTQTLCLAAHAEGLGTCLQASVASYAETIHKFLGMADTKKLMICISIGYPDPTAKLNAYTSLRAELNEFVGWVE